MQEIVGNLSERQCSIEVVRPHLVLTGFVLIGNPIDRICVIDLMDIPLRLYIDDSCDVACTAIVGRGLN